MLSAYLKMSGIELANHDRFRSYLVAGLGHGIQPTVDCGCPALVASYDDPGPYVTPAADSAPWYDPSRPESGHFAGMFIERIEGLGSPYADRTVDQGPLGGVLGGLRLGPKVITIRANLFGLSQMALDYGLQWVTAVLSGRVCGNSATANLGDLAFFAACPDATQGAECEGSGVAVIDESTLDLARTMFSGGLVSGPRVVDKIERGREVVAYEIVFTLAMESPYIAGTAESFLTAEGLDDNAAVAAESWECPGFDDPCAGLESSGPRQACVSFVEDTCDWNNSGEAGPNSWATQTWTATGEEVLSEGPPCGTTLTRTGDAGIDGCQRPSVRVLFGDAAGGAGPISVQFEVTEAQASGDGNLVVSLWNPATDTNIPILSLQKPAGTTGKVFSTPTGDAVNATGIGDFQVNYALPSGVDPGTLYLIFSAFGGNVGDLSGTPVDETVTNIVMSYRSIVAPECCNLDPGEPIQAGVWEAPCYEAPASTHRQIVSVDNAGLATERALVFTIANSDVSDSVANARVAIYDPTLIGEAAGTVPTVAGVWPSGVEEWECNALVGEFFIPDLPAGQTVVVDGRRRQVLRYPTGSPAEAESGERLVYGGETKPFNYVTIPPCAEYAVVVFADSGNTPATATVTVEAADLHLVSGVAR